MAQSGRSRRGGVMSASQCRAARAWLGMTQIDLAVASKVGLSTIKEFESERSERTKEVTATLLQNVFERTGIWLLFDERGQRGIGISVDAPDEDADT